MTEACDISKRPDKPEGNLDDGTIAEIIKESRNIAIVGLSNKNDRDSYRVGVYLRDHGFNIIPVHPRFTAWEGIEAYSSLAEVREPVDIIDIFRRSDAIEDMVEEIIAVKPKTVWLQLSVVNNRAAEKLRDAGIAVVQDKCLKIEHNKHFGE